MVEQAQAELNTKHFGHTLVDGSHRNLLLLQQTTNGQDEVGRFREMGTHVQTCFEHLAHSLVIGIGHAMLGLDILHRLAIAHHIAVKAIFLAQQFGKEIVTGRHRHTIPIVVAAHNTHRMSLLNNFLERIEIELVQFAWRYMRISTAITIASALGHTIDGIMFQRRSYALRLDALYHLRTQRSNQIRIFAVALQRTAPAGIAHHVEDRSIDIGIAQSPRLLPGDGTCLIH